MPRYPTGDETIDALTEFLGARLKAIYGDYPKARNDKPCLAEDWWVEDRIAEGWVFPIALDQEQSLRICWRWASNWDVEQLLAGARYVGDLAPDLLLHQMAELIPKVAAAALRQYEGDAK